MTTITATGTNHAVARQGRHRLQRSGVEGFIFGCVALIRISVTARIYNFRAGMSILVVTHISSDVRIVADVL
ncbi:hypothetical protein I4F81_008812 [Pyropia yezoensis]|uniref:Uncharacterized protein n=1 Tax=Pyropia yezoensis TaxID=2788 RepID=A0ACC3C915_PYRYE|nr:hypothetical protein I4F81_008812 [Neopyropia yezoensis]